MASVIESYIFAHTYTPREEGRMGRFTSSLNSTCPYFFLTKRKKKERESEREIINTHECAYRSITQKKFRLLKIKIYKSRYMTTAVFVLYYYFLFYLSLYVFYHLLQI